MDMLLTILLILSLIIIALIIIFRPRYQTSINVLAQKVENLHSRHQEDLQQLKEEVSTSAKDNRLELGVALKDFKSDMLDILKLMMEQNQIALQQIRGTLEERLSSIIITIEANSKSDRETISGTLKEFSLEQRSKFDELKVEQKELTTKTTSELEKITVKVEEKLTKLANQAKDDGNLMRDSMTRSIRDFQDTFNKNVDSFNNIQREKFNQLEDKQSKLIETTEKKLEEMRTTVDEKLQKTLNERLGQSFELVGKQLESVQKGLGEMQTLAQDVGGLKRVLTNVKMRGGLGEVQLSLLLEQILAPEQYETNVKTKPGSTESVEFAIKLPGQGSDGSVLWIPIDAKFPKDVYEHLQIAHDTGDITQIENAQRNLELTIKRMAKDIRDKYIDPPNTTDFAIMFLPFEGIYAEVVRKASLLEQLQREFKVVVTGPTTLAAILNSLQIGFRSLAIQKRSGEVWQILGAVKKEFGNFGGLLEKAQRNIQTASNQIDEVMGKRTRAIQRKLQGVEALNELDTKILLPEIQDGDLMETEDEL